MKTLSKILFIFIFILLSFTVKSQTQFGIKAGLNSANQKYTSEEQSMSPESKIGFHIGVIVEIPLGEKLAFQPGALYSQKGCKSGNYKLEFNYLDIPLNIMYKIDAGNMKVFGLVGPSIGYTLSAKEDGEDIPIGTDGVKRLDFGFNLGAGLQFGNIQASLNYNFGLTNIVDGGDSDNSIKNNVLGISVAYLFGGK